MKRLSLFALLACSLILVGCGSTEGNVEGDSNSTTKGEFAVESCNKYFDLMECTTKDLAEEQQVQMAEAIDVVKQEWKNLPEDQLQQACDATWDQILTMSDTYESMGCPIN